ncbi:MAG TPA: hypothetical protein VGX50_00010 [Longimicrobium sp.]|nr:hypothetical protein [Longimicrobium sp.]
MNTSGPDERTTPEQAAATPPAERRFARRIDCAPRLHAVAQPAPPSPDVPAPAPLHPEARP